MLKLFVALSLAIALASLAFGEQRDVISQENDADARFLKLERRMEELEQHDRNQQQEIKYLRSEVHIQKQRTASLERIIFGLKTKIRKYDKEEASVAMDTSTVRKAANRHDVKGIRSSEMHGNHESRIRRTENEKTIAFFATLGQHLEHAGVHQNIAFDNVITNIGGAYNPHFGSFVAPVTGVYVFSSTLMGLDHHVTHCSIVKNGQVIANLYVRGAESPYGNDSVTAVIHLNKGDDVSVSNNDADHSFHGYGYNTFAGFLLQQEFPSVNVVGK